MVREGAKIRNRYNQAPHLTQDTNGKVTSSQLDITNESQKFSPFKYHILLALISHQYIEINGSICLVVSVGVIINVCNVNALIET